ncbi:MAG: transcriptional regulator [Rhizobiales bacterium PAR1]|nr:MAG: transcriptional regulator [Rhizobiales bacterium PAR1]
MSLASVKSAARAIEVLEYFSTVRQPCSLKALCENLNYPQSSTTGLLKTLTAKGYLNYDRKARVYFPTLRVAALGEWVPQALFGNGRALEAMRDVHSATGESVSIAVKNDIFFQYIKSLPSAHALKFDVPEGEQRLLTQSAMGWLLLTSVKGEALDTLIRRVNIAARKEEAVSIPVMIERVNEARRQGYAIAENIPFQGGGTICVPLPVTIQGQPAVIGLGGWLERIQANRARYLSVLKRCVRDMQAEPTIFVAPPEA